jgi:hypothetical protein
MAGAGYKLFVNGNALSASDLNTYVQQQTVMVFASAAARTSALASVLAEGMVSYRTDSHVFEIYNGSAWVSAGISSPLTTKGDIWGYNTTNARIPVGTDGQLLKADSTNALGVSWATVSSGGMTLISETVASGLSSLSLSSIPQTYKQLLLVWSGVYTSDNATGFSLRLNNDSGGNYNSSSLAYAGSGFTIDNQYANTQISSTVFSPFGFKNNSATYNEMARGNLLIDNYASTSKNKTMYGSWSFQRNDDSTFRMANFVGTYSSTSGISSLDIFKTTGTGTFSNTTNTSIRLYGIS